MGSRVACRELGEGDLSGVAVPLPGRDFGVSSFFST